MKTKILTLSAICLCIVLAGCKGETQMEDLTLLESQNNVNDIHGLHYLHINDYSLDELADTIAQEDAPAAMCSELRRGDYVVRNLDWFQVDQATYLVRLDATDDRLASLQVCGMQDFIKHDTDVSKLDRAQLLRAIGGTFDGMNSAGVYIGANVVPYGQMTTDGSVGGDIDYVPEGASGDVRQYSTGLLTRVILDKATSLESAKQLILSNGWKDYAKLVKGGFQAHWLIATEEGSFVCEFVDGKPQFVDAESPKTVGLGNIMTNFSNYLYSTQGTIQSHGSGYERYELVKSQYDSLETLDDFKRMANLLFYSRMYSEDYNTPYYFWTEWSGEFEGGAEEVMSWKDSTKRQGPDWEAFVKRYQEQAATYDWRTRGYAKPTDPWWYTAHSSIWNLKTKTLTLDLEEQNLFKAQFTLEQ